MLSKNKRERNFVYISVLILISLSCFIVFLPYFGGGYSFAWYNDQAFQYNIFYEEWYRIVKESIQTRTLSFYSWDLFLGTDFYVSKLFTVVGDFIATPFFCFYRGDLNVDLLMCIETIICFLLSGLTSTMYLRKIGVKKNYLCIGLSILYTFGGFSLMFSGTYMFHRFYSLVPLLLYFVEDYLTNKRIAGFALLIAILFFQCYELLFSTCFFLVVYYLVSFGIKHNSSIFDALRSSIPLIISFFVGIIACGVAIIPLIMFLSGNPRVADFSFGNMFWSLRVTAGFFAQYIIPNFNFKTVDPPYLFYGKSYPENEYGFYMTSLILLSLFVLLKKGEKKEKRVLLSGELVLIVLLLFKPANMIVHGFSMPTFRWSFVLSLYHLFIMGYVLQRYDVNDSYGIYITISFVGFLTLLIAVVFFYDLSVKKYLVTFALAVMSFFVLAAYIFVLNRNKGLLFVVITLLSTIPFFSFTISNCITKYTVDDGAITQKFWDYYKQNDLDRMFRIYVDYGEIAPFNILDMNKSLKYQFMSTQTYDSAYSYSISPFLEYNGFPDWIINIDDPEILRMLGVKYYGIVNDRSALQYIDAEYAFNLDNIEMWKINNYNGMGHTYSSFLKRSDVNDFTEWNDILVIPDEYYDELSLFDILGKEQFNVLEYNRQYLKGEITCEGKTVLFISLPYSDGWTIIDQNYRGLRTLPVQFGFMGVIIDENVQQITMNYMTPGLKPGLLMSALGFVLLVVLVVFDCRTTIKNDLQNFLRFLRSVVNCFEKFSL